MAAKSKVTVSEQTPRRIPSPAERRAAQIAAGATKQADLKREAAERSAARALRDEAQEPSKPSKTAKRAL